MSIEEFERLTNPKPFPTDFNERLDDENEISRRKRDEKSKLFLNVFRAQNRNDDIRGVKKGNSKFHGVHVLNEEE